MILCAGLGERLRPLTLKRAKPAVEFLNVPMLGFPYYWLDQLKITDVVLNTHYLPETIRHAAMHVVSPETPLHLSPEEAILGSGGGLWNARFYLQPAAHFAVANGDGVVSFAAPDTIQKMLAFHRAQDALATLLVCPLEGVGTRIPGCWQAANGAIVNFGKVPKQAGLTCRHYASFMIMSERLWPRLPEGASNILYDVLEPAIAEGEKVLAYEDLEMRWFETGNVADYLNATDLCLSEIAAGLHAEDKQPAARRGRELRRLVERLAPDHTQKSDWARRHLIDDASEIDTSVNLSGFMVVGAGARIEVDCHLENCVVLPGAHVIAGATHRNEVII